MPYIKLEDLQKFPIRKDRYDKEHGNEHFVYGVETVLEYAEYLPTYTFDTPETKHGYWILWKPRRVNRNATYKCSCCGKLRSSYYNDVGEWEYCPCGAKMDAEDGLSAPEQSTCEEKEIKTQDRFVFETECIMFSPKKKSNRFKKPSKRSNKR